jgi:spore maturation protein CgeB
MKTIIKRNSRSVKSRRKILIPFDYWRGGFLNHIATELSEFYIVERTKPIKINIVLKVFFKLGLFLSFKEKLIQTSLDKSVIETCSKVKPDFFLNISGGGISPWVYKELKTSGICLISYVADNPFDPSPHRDKKYPLSLVHHDLLLVADHNWIRNIKLTTKATIKYYSGGVDFSVWDSSKGSFDKNLESEVMFTGASYDLNQEGLFRAIILNSISKNIKFKLWGDIGWTNRPIELSFLTKSYQGERLSFNSLLNALKSSKIYVNLPSPQISSDFQPRVFELGAMKVFQICPYSDSLKALFGEDIVMFQSIEQMNELINYYLNNDDKRIEKTEKLFVKINDLKFNWSSAIIKELNLL